MVTLRGHTLADGRSTHARIIRTREMLRNEVIGLSEQERGMLYRGVGKWYTEKGMHMVKTLYRFRDMLGLPGEAE
jgi:hypothetical protein